MKTTLIGPGKPWQNGVNERVNGKFRDECLSLEGNKTPGEFTRQQLLPN